MPPPQARGIACKVLTMGWKWAVSCAHSTLQDAFDMEFDGPESRVWTSPARIASAFVRRQAAHLLALHRRLRWLCARRRGPRGPEVPSKLAEGYSARDRRRLQDLGLGTHKEQLGTGLEECLGITIDARTRECRVKEEKLKLVVLATEATCFLKQVRPRVIQVLMGHWAWIVMVFRPAFAIPHQVYRWFEAHPDKDTPRPLWKSVAAELCALAQLAIFFVSDMGSDWLEQAFMTDASDWGYAALSCRATASELRREARSCDLQGWGVTTDQVFSRIERDVEAEGDEEDQLPGGDTPFGRTGRRGMAELFGGSGGLAEACRRFAGSWVENWEFENGEEFDLLDRSILAALMSRIKRGEFWWIHMGPPCSMFSVARLPRLRSRRHPWGLPTLSAADRMLVKQGSLMCLVALEVARLCLRLGIAFTWENPESSMMWEFPPVQEFLSLPGVFSYTVTYCGYGTAWKKPTRFVANREELRGIARRCHGQRGICSFSGCAHQQPAAARGQPDWRAVDEDRVPLPAHALQTDGDVPSASRPAGEEHGRLLRHPRASREDPRAANGPTPARPAALEAGLSREVGQVRAQQCARRSRSARGAEAPVESEFGVGQARAHLHGLDGVARMPEQGPLLGHCTAARLPRCRRRAARLPRSGFLSLGPQRAEPGRPPVARRAPRGGSRDHGGAQAPRSGSPHAALVRHVEQASAGARVAPAKATLVMLATLIFMLNCPGVRGMPKQRQPLLKKGAAAWDNATFTSPVLNKRLIIHAVDDNTNTLYEDHVRRFLIGARRSKMPMGSYEQRDASLARYLENMCYVDLSGYNAGCFTFHGFLHIFEDHRGRMPTSARALQSWSRLVQQGEGGPLATESVASVALRLFERGFLHEGIFVLLSYDCFLCEQDWESLRRNDVASDDTLQTALLFGVRERGERSKTGSNQGVYSSTTP